MPEVLVVDDEPAVRRVIEQTMIRFGYGVVTAEDGVEALEKLALVPIDLVISDMVMPGMDGVKLIGHVRERYPDVKIIAISGGGSHYTSQDCLDMAEAAGAAKTLMKPFPLSKLTAAAKELLGE